MAHHGPTASVASDGVPVPLVLVMIIWTTLATAPAPVPRRLGAFELAQLGTPRQRRRLSGRPQERLCGEAGQSAAEVSTYKVRWPANQYRAATARSTTSFDPCLSGGHQTV